MDAAQTHLALTHVPVVLSLVGLVLLITAMLRKNSTLIQTAFWVLLVGGLFAIPVYESGEDAAEIVTHLPGVTKAVIEMHEDMGKWALVAASSTGLLSFLGLAFFKIRAIGRLLWPLVLLAALATAGVLAYTAHLGGQVRHTEIRSGFTAPTNGSGTTEIKNGDD